MKGKYKNRIVGSGTMNPADLKANPMNWRKHPAEQSKALDDALSRLGWIQDVIVNKTTGHLIDGHLRVETALKNKEAEVPVKYVELTEEEEKLALATFDPLTMMAEQDDAMLKKLLEECGADIDMSQFHEDYDKLMRAEHTEEELEAVPDVPKEAKTKRGDVYKLGDHVLMCGDSLSIEDVETLMKDYTSNRGAVRVDMVLTDPPFGNDLGYGRGQLGERRILNDDDCHVLSGFFPSVDKVLKDNTHCLVWVQWRTFKELAESFLKYKLRTVVIWDKGQAGLSGGGFAEQYEMLCVYLKGKATQNAYCGNVWNIPREHDKRDESEHPHKKPIAVLKKALELCSRTGDIILDLFGGSGSTLIACEETGRKCRMMELSPEYCDVIVERWEKLTGKHAELIREGGANNAN